MAEVSAESTDPGRGALLEALAIPIDAEILTLALTHRSYAYENGGLPTNERLEFLGDSV
ncbi:MAG: ribonuclease III, partial [Geodermatophilaceae bacterium]|nr:ribonuclease III [Geodermatophilaceae bacterium]